jgi:hypothetical protein
MVPSAVPILGGVYLITRILDAGTEVPYYVGRSTNLRQRLYNNHLMGPLSNARLKKYLIDAEVCPNPAEAKSFIQRHCAARWIIIADYRRRKAVESHITAILFPKYGIDKEH